MADNQMDSQDGVDNLNVAISGEGGVADLTDKQLDALGAERDDIDGAELDDLDRGDDFDPDLVDRLLKEAKEKEAEEAPDPEAQSAADPEPAAEPEGEEAAAVEPEPEAEAEATAEAEDPEPAAAAPETTPPVEPAAEDPHAGFVPLSRFNEVNERRKVAEAQLTTKLEAETAAQQAEENAYDFDAAENAYVGLVLDGKTEEAVAKRSEINAALTSKIQTESVGNVRETAQSVQDQRDIDAFITTVETSYAELDPTNTEAYSEPLVNEVQALYHSYQLQGHARPSAFEKAVNSVTKLYGLQDRTAPPPAAAPEPAAPAAAPAPIKKTGVKLEAAQAAAPQVQDVGLSSEQAGTPDIPDLANMTDKEMEALPKSTLHRLRGDFVEGA